MRFMMMVIPEGYESAAPDAVPGEPAVSVEQGRHHAQRIDRSRAMRRPPRQNPTGSDGRYQVNGGSPSVIE